MCNIVKTKMTLKRITARGPQVSQHISRIFGKCALISQFWEACLIAEGKMDSCKTINRWQTMLPVAHGVMWTLTLVDALFDSTVTEVDSVCIMEYEL